jgi:capsular polysaccharide biosynthesis protein
MGRVDENWYHFLLDTIPRFLFLENLPLRIPVLVRSDLPETSKNFLRSLSCREFIEVGATDVVHVKNLYAVPGRSTIFDSPAPKGKLQVEFSPLVIKMLREKALKVLLVDANVVPEQRISLSRTSVTRNVINWRQVSQILNRFSFQDFNLDEKFFQKQVEVFNNSNFVVSPGGAVLSNIIFMNPGSKVLALTSFRGRQNNLWRELSEACGLKYFEIRGFPTFWGFNYLRNLHSNFYISLMKLRRILSREI